MHFTDIFVKRPVLATVVSLLILLAGLQAILQLPIRQFPEVSDTKIEITTVDPGATLVESGDSTMVCATSTRPQSVPSSGFAKRSAGGAEDTNATATASRRPSAERAVATSDV
jgi:hypothetical protein